MHRNGSPIRVPPNSIWLFCANQLRGSFYSAAVHKRQNIANDQEVRDTLRITRTTTEKLHDFAFRLATKRHARGGQGRVTCVDKANVFASMAFFRKIFDERRQAFPDIAFDYAYVDATALDMVRRPWELDVLVMENMFGDILCDLERRFGRRHGYGIMCRDRRCARSVPAGTWQRARHHGPGQGQSAGNGAQRRVDAGLSR